MVENKEPGEVSEEMPSTETPGIENESAESSTSQNEELIEIVKRFAPDADVSTPQGKLDAAEKVLKSMVPIYDKLYDVALVSQESASFVNDLLETGDVAKSLARNFDPEELKALWEEVTDDSNESERTMHSAKVASAKERKDMVEKNKEISIQAISEFMVERKHWPEEKAQEFEDRVIKHYDDGNDGIITKDDLAMLEKAFNYDTDVAEAEETGKIIGKNENIVAKKLSKDKEKELLPDLNGGGIKPKPAEPEANSFVTMLKNRAEQKPVLS